MMQIEQHRDLGRQYLRISDSGRQNCRITKTDFREQMLLHNDIAGIMKFDVFYENDDKIYEYLIEDMVSLASYCDNRKPRRAELENILGSILEAVYRGHEFMLQEDDYLIEPDTVFIDRNGRVSVAYFPGSGGKLRERLQGLAEYLMNKVDYGDDSAVLMIYSFYMCTKNEQCMLEDLFAVVRGESVNGDSPADVGTDELRTVLTPVMTASVPDAGSNPVPDTALKEIVPGGAVVGNKSNTETAPVGMRSVEDAAPDLRTVLRESPLRLRIISAVVPAAAALLLTVLFLSGILINNRTGRNDVMKSFMCIAVIFLGTVTAERILWSRFAFRLKQRFESAAAKENEATVLLTDDGMPCYPFSLVSEQYPSINISRFPYFIGKGPQNVDYILDHVGISRFHLKVDREGDGFVIADMNSTNGSFLNGQRLAPHMSYSVRRGDEIRLGNSIFYCN